MPSHSKPDLSVRALVRNLNEELDRKKVQKVDDLLLSKAQGSLRRRLGSLSNDQDVQNSRGHCRGELFGVIFMCNRRTWKECLGQCLFGLPIGKKSLVEQVVPGMKLFLFEYEHRQLWGVFEAISYGGMDIIPDAYTGGSFPCQVRVKVPEDCVALYEEEFYNAVKDNYYSRGKFKTELSRKQVYHLTSLFERKYLRAKGMEPNLLEYEHRRCIEERYDPMRPLLLTNQEAHIYPEDHNITSRSHNLYTPKYQITEDGPFLESEEGVDFVYRNMENFTSKIGHRSMEISPLVPFSDAIGQGNSLPFNVDITRFTNLGGQLVYSTLTTEETIETVVIPGHVSRLHSDRLDGKSVWARISGRAKPLMAAEISQKPGKIPPSSVHPSPKLPAESVVEEIISSPVLDDCSADMTIEAAEEFAVGFKRRRVTSNNSSANASETRTSNQRRKLTRPVFEAPVGEPLAENATCQPTKIDLNVALESEEGFINSDHLTLSLSTRATELSLPQAEELTCSKQNSPEPVALVQADNQDRMSQLDEVLLHCETLGKLVGKADAELGGHTLSLKEQSFDLLPNISSNCTCLESMADDCSGANTLSLAPCTPAKEVFGSSSPVVNILDEGQGLAIMSHNLGEEIPLKLETRLPNVEIQLEDEVISQRVSDDSGKGEIFNEATVLGTLNGVSSKQSNTISLDCTSGSTLLNSVDLKAILSGLQVSGIKLQLGSTPCLILQLGDSSSNVGNQDQEGANQTCLEGSLKEPSSGEILAERPSSS
ncbi:hypothetical protein GOP47_0000458 [Adiantum capillus-veneris]|uniref:DCD domain-containing protein n=1 Tax=Adiantum capillus-veneris TaxID=13818 RepID=A0A9D4VDX6_ADICA|nr:hypothetical protein GOP47_0000458 [Adiantum capillus-veneris]